MSKLGIPAPPPAAPGEQTMHALKEFAEVSAGVRGDKRNKRPTVQELLDAGVITDAQAVLLMR